MDTGRIELTATTPKTMYILVFVSVVITILDIVIAVVMLVMLYSSRLGSERRGIIIIAIIVISNIRT